MIRYFDKECCNTRQSLGTAAAVAYSLQHDQLLHLMRTTGLKATKNKSETGKGAQRFENMKKPDSITASRN
jgi:hypothetical protein